MNFRVRKYVHIRQYFFFIEIRVLQMTVVNVNRGRGALTHYVQGLRFVKLIVLLQSRPNPFRKPLRTCLNCTPEIYAWWCVYGAFTESGLVLISKCSYRYRSLMTQKHCPSTQWCITFAYATRRLGNCSKWISDDIDCSRRVQESISARDCYR